MREVVEETTINAKLGKMIFEFKTPEGREHYLFECSYVSGEPQLHDNSPEKKENSPTNLFKPMWLSIKELPNIRMWPQETKPFLISYFK